MAAERADTMFDELVRIWPVRKVVVGQEMVYWGELQGAKRSIPVGIASICNAADPFKRPFDGWQGLSEQALGWVGP
jgi:hypothetical protein